jgi:hypothetical protein
MKKHLGALVFTLLAGNSAFAADMPLKAPL